MSGAPPPGIPAPPSGNARPTAEQAALHRVAFCQRLNNINNLR
jgi:hypothetical protein